MADVNASAGGTLNQDPFSVNMADGVGQGREPEISPTSPDDDLNKDADKLDFLNDTDHSMMPNDTNMLQSMQEMMAESDSGDHELRGEFSEAGADLQNLCLEIEYLNRYKRRLSSIGMSHADLYALEGRYPNLGLASTIDLSSHDRGQEAAMEALDGKIGEFLKRASEIVSKFISSILARVDQFKEFMIKHNFDQRIARLKRRMTLKTKFYSTTELAAKIDPNTWNNHYAVRQFRQMFGINMKLTELRNIVDTSNPHSWIRAIDAMGVKTAKFSANKEAIKEYTYLISSAAKKLNSFNVDDFPQVTILDIRSTLDEAAEKSPFTEDSSTTLFELYSLGMQSAYMDYCKTISATVADTANNLKVTKANMLKSKTVDADKLKEYSSTLTKLCQTIYSLQISFEINHKAIDILMTFLDFAMYSCDSVNGLAAKQTNAA